MYTTNNIIDFTFLHGPEYIYYGLPKLAKYLWRAWPFTTKYKANILLRENCRLMTHRLVDNGPVHILAKPYIRILETWRDINGDLVMSRERFDLLSVQAQAIVNVELFARGKITSTAVFKTISEHLAYHICKKLVAEGVKV